MDDLIIAIDGPAASGKTTVATRLAVRLNIKMVDSGSMYRAVALFVIEDGIDPCDEEHVVEVAVRIMGEMKFESSRGGEYKLMIGDRDITEDIRSPYVNEAVSPVSEFSGVRSVMVKSQKRIAAGDAVVEGRDIGTVVFPDAGIKVYLDADINERAERRFLEQESRGINQPLEEVRDDIETRDRIDLERKLSPLAKAHDATYIDTTGKGIEEVVDEIITHLEKRK